MPTLIEILAAISLRHSLLQLPWSDFWVFKEDIKSCFPQMDMQPESAVLLAIRLTVAIVFIHLAGSFGWTGAPMAWAIIGAAMLRFCHRHWPKVDLFLICDDFVGFGLLLDCLEASKGVRDHIIDTCGPGSVSLDKSVLTQRPVVLGYQLDFLNPNGPTVSPNDEAIHKMTYHFFSFDASAKQPLLLWQILHSYAERYSHGMRGMRPFVSAFAHMIRKCGPPVHSGKLYVLKHQYAVKNSASPSALFAIEMWRVVCYLLFLKRQAFSIPISSYLAMHGLADSAIEFHSISDASPYRICAALYNHITGELVAWTSVLLPYQADSAETRLPQGSSGAL
jgi:hypothetical protein